MTIQDLGSIGELVAALATVATLAYLAFQIRQNTQQLANSARDARTTASMAIAQGDALWNLHVGLSPTATPLYFRRLESYDSLGNEEKDRFSLLAAHVCGRRPRRLALQVPVHSTRTSQSIGLLVA